MESWPMLPAKKSPSRVQVHNPNRTIKGAKLKLTELEREIQRMYREEVPQQRTEYSVRMYEYEAPFNYPNVNCELGREGSGTGPHPDGMEIDIPPFGAVTVEEEHPIIGVAVLGSFCVSPGTVLVYGEPLEWKYGRTGVKYKVTDLWGEHEYGWGASDRHSEGNRHNGLISAHFDIVECSKVTIMGYAPIDVHVSLPGKAPAVVVERWNEWWNDPHLNIRTIRIQVRVPIG